MSTLIRKACFTENFEDTLDEEILPAVMCAISKEVRPLFQEALLGAVPGASLHDGDGASHIEAVELKVGPTKLASRVAVKIAEYRKEKDEWPYAQFVMDVMRASFICETAEDFVRAYGAQLVLVLPKILAVSSSVVQSKLLRMMSIWEERRS